MGVDRLTDLYSTDSRIGPCGSHSVQGHTYIDPRRHQDQSHVLIHHPGSLEGADFCDAGVDDGYGSPA